MLLTVSPAQALAADPAPPQGYTFDETTGLWQNGTYAWNPNTGQTTPLKTTDYSYNPETKHWDTNAYRYDAGEDKYVANQPTVTNPPSDTKSASPTAQTAGLTSPTNSSKQTLSSQDKAKSSNLFDNFYKADISNRFQASATSGDASVSHNTAAGSATSGQAMTTTTLINLLASSLSQDGKTPYTFITNILGNVFGDLTIDPSQLAKQLPTDSSTSSNTKVNNSTDSQINNQLDLSAKSGSASVEGNTKAGDATSGNAAVVANLINAINSSISSGQSFIGAINISGNLNGDILLPKGMLDQLLASNADSTVAKTDHTLAVVNNDQQSINNNLNLTANSGQASVTGNTEAGSATSGQAKTSLTVLNFSGHQVADANTLLVFVNVLGHWVGMIFDAPVGATAAALGGQVSSRATSAANTNVNNSNQSQITNDLTATATSGDASVTHNTQAGDATSGDASVAVNVLNLTDSQISSANWFGVLFINILGNWFGSFGVDTAAGSQPSTSGGKGSGSTPTKSTPQPAQVFKFTARSNNHYSPLHQSFTGLSSLVGSVASPITSRDDSTLSAANPAASEANNPNVPVSAGSSLEQQKDQPNWLVLSLMLSTGAAVAGRQLILMIRRSRLSIPY